MLACGCHQHVMAAQNPWMDLFLTMTHQCPGCSDLPHQVCVSPAILGVICQLARAPLTFSADRHLQAEETFWGAVDCLTHGWTTTPRVHGSVTWVLRHTASMKTSGVRQARSRVQPVPAHKLLFHTQKSNFARVLEGGCGNGLFF